MEKNQITLSVETVEFIIDKLQELKDVEEFNLTDWVKDESTEDRMSFAKSYIECGNLIKHLKETLYGN
jgi:hypothetical protein